MNIAERNIAELLTSATGPDATITVNGKVVQDRPDRAHPLAEIIAFIDGKKETVSLAQLVKRFPGITEVDLISAIGSARNRIRYFSDNSAELLIQRLNLLQDRAELTDEEFATRLDQLVVLSKCSASDE